jgi:hypothetical protein
MAYGKTIQIFIPDENPRGIRIAEITSRIVQIILVPRANFDEAASRIELQDYGVYFLVGNPEDESKPLLYVGEGEDCFERLKDHNKRKDFWSVALVVISKSHSFTKTHVKFLEWFSYTEALKAGRFRLDNSNVPNQTYAPESIKADLLDHFDTIKILLSTLGYPIFDAITKPSQHEIVRCTVRDIYAEGQYTEEGFVVFKGSKCFIEESRAIGSWIKSLRAKLKDEDILAQDGQTYKFTSDYLFTSPSAAAGVILGRNSNGWVEWKYEDGRTLSQVKRSEEE